MAPAGKTSAFHRQGNDWLCNSSLPSDITVVVDEVKFHLHKFPLISRCGLIAAIIEKSESSTEETLTVVPLEEIPGGADTFLTAVSFCYGERLEFTPRNIVILYCAAYYLSMTNDYGEDNLLPKSESYFHKHILKDWKGCILALQSCELVIPKADKLEIISRCIKALSVMICTDTSLFGWPMMMYGSLQSPGGSILWNGINTGAKLHSNESDWWFEDVSCLCVEFFERLIQTLHIKGISSENVARSIMYYCKKYLPGLGRWKGGQSDLSNTVAGFSMKPANVNQNALLESVTKILPVPEIRGKSFCHFLLGLLCVVLILGVNHTCQDSLERRIGIQLDLATLDALLIPTYSDSDTLYNTDCVERMIRHFVSSEQIVTSISPSSVDPDTSPVSGRVKRVAKLVDNYIAEVASDVNLKPGKLRTLAEALPDSSRSLHDGLYCALDVYFKAHPWLSDKEREQLCSVIEFQKLSIDACSHASQNERLPLRIILQVLFFEQMQLRTALARCLNVLDTESAAATSQAVPNDAGGQIVEQDRWIKVVRENQVLKVDMEQMRSRVGELEQEFSKIKEEMKKATKSHSYLSSR